MSNNASLDRDLVLNGYIECPVCKKKSRLVQWDLATKNNCFTRERRRAFISLEQKKAYQSKYIYECPKCGKGTEGNHLRVFGDL